MPDQLLAGLKKQRSTNKAKLTNLVKYAKQGHAFTELSELTTRLQRVEKLMVEFTELELRIFTCDPNEESDLTYEENYYAAISELNNWIRTKNLNKGVLNLDTTNNDTQMGDHSQVKLPKIHIPPFSGEYSEWQSFHDMFNTTIHEAPNLNPVQKFQYLKGLLRGEAAFLLRHVTVTDGNYIGALNKLKERYDRKKHIINSFIRTFIEQPPIHNSNAANMKRLMDTSDEVIRGLQALGTVGETRDPWLVYILVQKLDDKSKALWADYSADVVNPEFSMFLKFLSRRIDALETLMSPSRRVVQKPEVKSHIASEDREEEISNHAATKSISYQCAMCRDKGHSIFQCSKFQELNPIERKQFAKQNNRCFNCLSSSHPIFRCPSKRRCQKCGKKHNTLLHEETSSDNPKPSTSLASPEVTRSHHSQSSQVSAILPTAIVNVIDSSGKTTQCRALLDSGSQASFISESCAQRLRLEKRNSRISISGLGQSCAGISKGLVTITLKPDMFPSFSIEALVMNKITGKLPPQNIDCSNIKSYHGIKLADPNFHKTDNIDLLIGADHFFSLIQDGQIKTGPNKPVLQNTVFGWIVSGQPDSANLNGLVTMLAMPNPEAEVMNIDQTLRRFWELESINSREIILSPEETFCEEHFTKNVKRSSQGRFTVNLPFKKSPKCLGESLPAAIQRLRAMERRFARDPAFSKLYHGFMAEYQQLNHMIEAPPPNAIEAQYYLPHHGVFKTSDNKTKIRVVFDGSSKSSTGCSLNDCLAVGSTVQSSLYAIILRFREHKIAFSADVEKMYRQVNISPEDSTFQRIVWRSDPSQPIRHFQLMTVTYGLASASFLATRAVKQISIDVQTSDEGASKVIANDMYVDDLMTGAENEEDALNLKKRVSEILNAYGFPLRKWKSNSDMILRDIPQEFQDDDNKVIQDRNQLLAESVKVLGINWNPKTDSFTFTAQLADVTKFTKRTVLSEASRLFDPIGWLSPVVISFKIFLQMLWCDNLEWDDPLPTDKHTLWNKLRSNLKTINAISIPRFIQTTRGSRIDMHGFCDASQRAYAAVIYFRIVNPNGETYVELVSAKTKVAPIRQQTLPRLELCAAVLLTSLINLVKKESNQNICEVHAWTDSQIVLDWLGSHPRRWSTFVGNRTSEILSTLTRSNWKHVSSADNPADCASRGLAPTELKSHVLWWNGPSWLCKNPEYWPPQTKCYGHQEEQSNRVITFTISSTKPNEWFDQIMQRYSSFRKLQRVMCYIMRFIGNLKRSKGSRISGVYLRREELLHVIRLTCQHQQYKYYKDEILTLQNKKEISKASNLKSLDPFLDNFGLLRVGGRLQHSILPYSTQHPIIINPRSTIALLLLRDLHLDNKHAGPSLLLAIARQEYWIPSGKSKAKEVIQKCITCTKFKADCQKQLMGSLPSSRVELTRPFLKTGVDYAGPILIHLAKGRGQKTYKAYICLFICLSTKAVHLELVSDLSSDAFLGALKRFTARRGICSEIHSDNGSNFVGSDSKLKQAFSKLIKSSNNISDYFSRFRITWNFIPPQSPHFGGLWEAAIKSTKFHIKRVIGRNILTLEEMNTLLAEVEAILNCRPLCAINDMEVDPLTPSHFLLGHPLTKVPEPDITHLKTSHLNRWQMVQQITQHFWKRWYMEYLTSLQQRTKWRNRKPSLQIDDIVLIKDKNLPVSQWLLAKVIELHPGADGLVRVVTLKTSNNEIKRPVHKLCLLPVSDQETCSEE